MAWTIRDKTVLITGATRGVGFEAAVALAAQGARVIAVGRDPARLSAALDAIRARTGASADGRLCDLTSLTDVRRLADHLRRDPGRLDVLINNAGAVHARRELTPDGFEATFAVNHLAHFLLTTRLMDRLTASAPARVITVASAAHRDAALDFDDLQLARGYGILRAYGQSKLANVLFARELARRLAGTGVASNSVHPGVVDTHIWSGAPLLARPFLRLWLWRSSVDAATGAAPLVRLAADPSLEGATGRYFDRLSEADPAPAARDDDAAARLWQESQRLVGD